MELGWWWWWLQEAEVLLVRPRGEDLLWKHSERLWGGEHGGSRSCQDLDGDSGPLGLQRVLIGIDYLERSLHTDRRMAAAGLDGNVWKSGACLRLCREDVLVLAACFACAPSRRLSSGAPSDSAAGLLALVLLLLLRVLLMPARSRGCFMPSRRRHCAVLVPSRSQS